MSVTFQICAADTARVHVESNTHPMDTQRGTVNAEDVVQGDFIRNTSGEPRREVLAAPTIT